MARENDERSNCWWKGIMAGMNFPNQLEGQTRHHQNSKGLEFRSVIFIGLGQIETSETQTAQNMKLLYKACPA